MTNQITELADILDREITLGEVPIPVLDFWLRNNIGQLNSRLDLCIEIIDNDFSPQLNEEEKDIFKAIYQIDLYKRQINRFTGAGGYSISDQVTQIKENGRTTTIAPRNNTAKVLADLRKDLVNDLNQLIIAYKFNRSDPRESKVVGDCDCYGNPYPPYPYRSREF